MATDYPVIFDVQRPEKFDRAQLFLRLVVAIIAYAVLSLIGWAIYLVFPAFAAVQASNKGGEKYLEEDGERVAGWLRWLMALSAYLYVVIDKFPSEKPEEFVRFEVRTSGSPTVGSALLRLIYSIPSYFVLSILGIVSFVILIIAVISILITETYSEGLYNFQRGVLRWQARLLGYHASLVDQYPPFALDTAPEGEAGAPAPAAPSAPPDAPAPPAESGPAPPEG